MGSAIVSLLVAQLNSSNRIVSKHGGTAVAAGTVPENPKADNLEIDGHLLVW